MPPQDQIAAILPFLDKFTAKGFNVGEWDDGGDTTPLFD